jgi:ribonuclease R
VRRPDRESARPRAGRGAPAVLDPAAILERLRAAGAPVSLRELADVLELDREERVDLKRALRALVREGLARRLPRARYEVAEAGALVAGRLRRSLARVGFVCTDRLDEPDVMVPARHLLDAMDGDRVLARVTRVDESGRREGRVVRILERRHARLWGEFHAAGRGGRVAPYVERFPGDIEIPPGACADAADGMVVGVELTRFPSGPGGAAGRVVETLGYPEEPGVDLQVVLRKYGLSADFPPEVEEEAARVAHEPERDEIARRVDYRRQPVVTIDSETAMDFDDAVSVEELRHGGWRLYVHIADVSHYVRPGGALDGEAFRRGTSVYFPGFAVPMLPRLLSDDWCSLRPEVDRLVLTCVIDFDRAGVPGKSAFHAGIIHSAARMTYTSVKKILEDHDAEERARYQTLVPLFESMERLCARLLARRRERGSLDFDLPEAEIVLDEEGRTRHILPSERNLAHRVIEEFMLAANEAVARRLHEARIPAVYRIHERPNPRKLQELDDLLRGFGYGLGADPEQVRPADLQQVLALVEGKPEERFLSTAILRSLQLARYSDQNAGHFGLAAPLYTHFTSPIRRYPDLAVHRLLRRVLEPEPLGAEERKDLHARMPGVASESSRLERQADEAERELVEWKTLAYMNERVGEEYEGWVAGVMPFGVFVRLDDLFVEGLVHVSALGEERFQFVERGHFLKSERRRAVIRLGDRVRVRVDRVNTLARQVDFSLLEHRGEPWHALTRRRGKSRFH